MSDDPILAALARIEADQTAMEDRLMARINDYYQEKLIERMRVTETSVLALIEIGHATNNALDRRDASLAMLAVT